jgi:hypothetical protein
MKYIITETQLDTFLRRRYTMDELEELKNDYRDGMDNIDFEDSADREDYIYALIDDFISRKKFDEFSQSANDIEFLETHGKYIRALLKFLHSK